jgi:hypothetical protein
MKKSIIALLLIALISLASCVTPYAIVETRTTDSLGHTVRTIQRVYDDVPYTNLYVLPQHYLPIAVPYVMYNSGFSR